MSTPRKYFGLEKVIVTAEYLSNSERPRGSMNDSREVKCTGLLGLRIPQNKRTRPVWK
jgi:hypothetical protein